MKNISKTTNILVLLALAFVVSETVYGKDFVRPLPARSSTLIRNAYVVTMDPALGDLPDSDILVREGKVIQIGKNLEAPAGVSVIDGTKSIVMPGLIETHWHMWNTLVKGMEGSKTGHGYFDVVHRKAAPQFTPDDSYLGVVLSGAEAIDSGITYVHDWSHNLRSPDHARAEISALNDLGIRARFSYGYYTTIEPAQMSNLQDVASLQKTWSEFSKDGLIDLGVAVRGPLPGVPEGVWKNEINIAQSMHLPVTVHVNQVPSNKEMVQKLCDAGLLNKDMLLIHAIQITDSELDCIARTGTAVSLSPESEMRVGYGFPKINEMVGRNVRLSLSVDTVSITGNGNLFSVMRTTQNVAGALQHDEFALSARQLLELVTIRGAEAIGMAEKIGSLTPGKRADLILINTRAVNLTPISDAANALVQGVQPANVKMVMVDGRILKKDGEVTIIDKDLLYSVAQKRNMEILHR